MNKRLPFTAGKSHLQKRGGGSTMSFLDELRDLIAPHGSNATATALALGTASKALVGGKKRGRTTKRSKSPAKKTTAKKTVAKRSKSPTKKRNVKKTTAKKTVAKRSKSPTKKRTVKKTVAKRSKSPVKRSKSPVKKRVVKKTVAKRSKSPAKKRTVKRQRGGDLLRELVAPHGLGATAAAATLLGLNHLKSKKTRKPIKKRGKTPSRR